MISGHWCQRSSFAGPTKLSIFLGSLRGSQSHIKASADGFDARGKFQVCGRGDHFGKTDFDMTIWRGRDRRMLVRFWSKDDDIEWRAFKIVGMLDTDITGSRMMGDWIPYCLRVAYDGWTSDEW